jgi:hypothetical protein
MQMRNLCEALSPALRSIRQQEYYADPKFHASIGWALLHQARQTKPSPTNSSDLPSPLMGDSVSTSAKTPDEGTAPAQEWPTTSCLPQELIASLNSKYSGTLSSLKDGIFPVEAITLKIGKETFTWKFASMSQG